MTPIMENNTKSLLKKEQEQRIYNMGLVEIRQEFHNAYMNNDLEAIDYIMNTNTLRKRLHSNVFKEMFQRACIEEKKQYLHYVMTNNIFSTYFDIEDCNVLRLAANEKKDTIKLLLTGEGFWSNLDINASNGILLKMACQINDQDWVNFLLNSPELKEHADVYIANQEILKTVLKAENMELLSILVFQYKWNINEEIINIIEKKHPEKKTEIYNLLEKRKIHDQLQDNLNVNVTKTIKQKI